MENSEVVSRIKKIVDMYSNDDDLEDFIMHITAFLGADVWDILRQHSKVLERYARSEEKPQIAQYFIKKGLVRDLTQTGEK